MSNATTNQRYADQQPRIMGDEYRTRYIELSTVLDHDMYFHGTITITVAVLQDDNIMLTRFKSEEAAVNFELSKDEFTALVSGYTAFLVDLETSGAVGTTRVC
jgi:hypothetical protein